MDLTSAEQAAEAAKGMTFEKVWQALMEDRRRMEEIREENREVFKRMDQSQEDLKRIVAEVSKNIGGLNNTLGQLMEAMFSPELYYKFNDLGFNFIWQENNKKYREGNRVIAEADCLFENKDCAMVVEVKTKLTDENVDEHLARIAIIRRHMDARDDKRKLLGAVAGGIVSDQTLAYAFEKGLFVVVQTGDSVAIADTPDGFILREW